MPTLTLPNQEQKDYAHSVTGLQIAEDISAGLARQSIAVKVNGTVRDLSYSITEILSSILMYTSM